MVAPIPEQELEAADSGERREELSPELAVLQVVGKRAELERELSHCACSEDLQELEEVTSPTKSEDGVNLQLLYTLKRAYHGDIGIRHRTMCPGGPML